LVKTFDTKYTGNCYFTVLSFFLITFSTIRAPLTTECVAEAYRMRGCPCSKT
jgi:hypothetical protein